MDEKVPSYAKYVGEGTEENAAESQNPLLFSFLSDSEFPDETRLVYGSSSCSAAILETCEKLKGEKAHRWQ